MTPVERQRFRAALLAWYDLRARTLPWRARGNEPVDPYRVWLSEVMLQQTRVETVRAYFERWLGAFPTLDALAAASGDEVLKAWEGLGYYSRARNFHTAVREVVERYGGRIPDDPDTFRSLPGVGRYTAGAVMSIAFGREEPVVDGNVKRVYARLFDAEAAEERDVWAFAEALVRGDRPGDLNQALMELGATVCTPRRAGCEQCPVERWCAAKAAGTVALRPGPRHRREIPTECYGVALVRSPRGEVLITRRPPQGRLAGMWEFPGVVRRPDESAADAAARAALETAGVRVRVEERLGVVKHAFTHVRAVYEAFRASPVGASGSSVGTREAAWVAREELMAYAMPRAQRRLAELLFRQD